jgi:hypothetical protein
MMIGDFRGPEGSKSIGFSGGQLGLVVEPLDDATGDCVPGTQQGEEQLAMRPQHSSDLFHGLSRGTRCHAIRRLAPRSEGTGGLAWLRQQVPQEPIKRRVAQVSVPVVQRSEVVVTPPATPPRSSRFRTGSFVSSSFFVSFFMSRLPPVRARGPLSWPVNSIAF